MGNGEEWVDMQRWADIYSNDPQAESYQARLDNAIEVINQFVKSVPAQSEEADVLGEENGEYRPKIVGISWAGAYEAFQELEKLTREAADIIAGSAMHKALKEEAVEEELVETIVKSQRRMDAATQRYEIADATALATDQKRRIDSEDKELAIDYAIQVADGESEEYFRNRKEELAETEEEWRQKVEEFIGEVSDELDQE